MQTNPESAAVEAVAIRRFTLKRNSAGDAWLSPEQWGRWVEYVDHMEALDALRGEVAAAYAAVESKAGWEWKRRAEEAERRVAELTGLLSDTVGNLRRMANDEFADCDQVRLEHVVERIDAALTGADPT